MKVTILTENAAGRSNNQLCMAEWGLSLYIEIDGKRILFDTGHKGTFTTNAKQLGININDIDFLVLSHHHWDHTGGLRFHKFPDKKKVVIHPRVLEKLPPNEAEHINDEFEVIPSTKPLEFYPDIFFLGEIPRQSTFEKGVYKDDPMEDDTAIAIKTSKGLIIVTGCSHAGICNISEYAKKVTGQQLYALVGGFHLFEDDDRAIDGTIEHFKKEPPILFFPMHCVDMVATSKLYQNFNVKKYAAGDVFEIETEI